MTTPKMTAFLNDSAVRARAVSGLVGVLQQETADGYMLDFVSTATDAPATIFNAVAEQPLPIGRDVRVERYACAAAGGLV